MKTNEIFGPTIQGEGKSVGMKVLFLRLSLCNLHCVWCDTPYTWNWTGTPFVHPKKFDYSNEVHEMSIEEIVDELEELGTERKFSFGILWLDETKSLVISGGEPLLQQKELVPLIRILKGKGWWIEIETNGTMKPTPEMFELVDQFNCSPKLSNSGNDHKLRVRSEPLESLAQSSKVCFKFVVATEADVPEILEYVNTYKMKCVYLMPLGMTREELDVTREQTQELCLRLGFNFSDRLHVVQFGGVRAV